MNMRSMSQIDLRDLLDKTNGLIWSAPSRGLVSGALAGSPLTGYHSRLELSMRTRMQDT